MVIETRPTVPARELIATAFDSDCAGALYTVLQGDFVVLTIQVCKAHAYSKQEDQHGLM
jgi:hypothetical protein